MSDLLTFEQFCEEIPDNEKPWIDRESFVHIEPSCLTRYNAEFWRENGYLILRDFIPVRLIDDYVDRYETVNGAGSRTGFSGGTPYMKFNEIKDLCLYKPLMGILNALIGENMGMSLNLTDWVSTERNWHQDDYLNPAHVNGHYLACWIALDDISPDSGPFEFVPGSHKWPVMRGEKVKAMLSEEEQRSPNWPRTAERFLDDVFEQKILDHSGERHFVYLEQNEPWVSEGDYYVDYKHPIKKWDDAKKGDVLIWHSWLAHRGSKPNNPDLLRKSLICHYSGINHRPDMQPPVLWENGESRGYYFPF